MRNILIYFAIKYQGDYLRVIKALKEKESVSKEELDKIDFSKINAITYLDENYPNALRNTTTPPLVLFYKGELSLLTKGTNLAVIGTRISSDYGVEVTEKVLNELFEIGDVTIVSGFAKGIDSLAHKIALKNNQKTIAVLGCGIDVCYPHNQRELFDEIGEKGLIISEYPEGVQPQKYFFPLRNRIIAGLSKAILITDAEMKSGTQITVNYGVEMGKDILAIPHPILEDSFCNYLIKEGAYPILTGKDIADQIF